MAFSLPVAGIVAKAAVVGDDDGRAHRGLGRKRDLRTQAVIVVGSDLDAENVGHGLARVRHDDVDNAVQRIGTVQRAAGTADHLDRLRLLGIDFEQLVDVAKPRGAARNAVLQREKCAAGARAGQYR